jgi:hypothetical protein
VVVDARKEVVGLKGGSIRRSGSWEVTRYKKELSSGGVTGN